MKGNHCIKHFKGEPKLFLELHLNGKTTPVGDIYDNREINRRNAVTKTKIFFKVFFNGKEVCQSSLKLIGQDFIIPVGQIFPIQIIHWPETLKVQIIEGSTLRTSVLAEIDVPFPDSTSSIDKADVAVHDFVSDQVSFIYFNIYLIHLVLEMLTHLKRKLK